MPHKIDKKTELQSVAAKRKLRALSKRFRRSADKYWWQCLECDTKWQAAHNNIKNGRGCPKCAQLRRNASSSKYSIATLRAAASTKGGRCLEPKYLGFHEKHRWLCAHKHGWTAAPATVLRLGTWCPYCDGQRLEDPLGQLRDLARSRGGSLLSKKYVNNVTKVHFQCRASHKFSIIPSAAKRGQWCSGCAAGLGETIVRQAFEHLLQSPFPATWPAWLVGARKRALQLDGYNDHLKIAFEHQGNQHSRRMPFFSPTEAHFTARKDYDRLKRRTCKKRGVRLIEIPQVPTAVPFSEVIARVAKELTKRSIPFDRGRVETFQPDLKTTHAERQFKRLITYAESNGGTLLSTTFLGMFTKHKWRCKQSHTWSAIPANMLRKKYWCPVCGVKKRGISSRKGSLQDAKALAFKRGGRCLSKTFLGVWSQKLEWKCGKCQSVWQASPRQIVGYSGRKGSWCPICKKNKRPLHRGER